MYMRVLAFVVPAGLLLAACQPLADLAESNRRTTETTTDATSVAAGTVPLTDTVAVAPGGHTDDAAATTAITGTQPVTGSLTITGTARGEPAAAALGAPKPGDMLTTLEQERATALALGSPELESMVTGALDRDAVASTSDSELRILADRPSYRVLYSERTPNKQGQPRAADVSVYRYDTDQAAVSTVNLADGAVVEQALPASYMPPLVAEEIAEAAAVARADDRVIAALRAAGLDVATVGANALLTRGLEPGAACATHRCLKVFFHSADRPVPTFEVVVDLSALNVVEVLQFPTSDGSGDQ